MKEEKPNYGTANAPDGVFTIIELLQLPFEHGRKVTVGELEDNTIMIQLENEMDSGRIPHVNIRLTQDSFDCVLSAMIMWKSTTPETMENALKTLIEEKVIQTY